MPRSSEQRHEAHGRSSRFTSRRLHVAAVLALLSALVATNAVALAANSAKSRRVPPAPALILPSANQCVSHRGLAIQVRKVSRVTVLGVAVKVNGRLFKKFKRSQIAKFLKLSSLPTGTFRLSVTAKATDGRSVTVKRTYRACATNPPPTPTPTLGATGPFGACSTAAPASSPSWLSEINRYRLASGLCPVTDNPAWDAGLLAHFVYLEETPASYMTGQYASAHTENPASPYYTAAGAAEGGSSDLILGGASSPLEAIDRWLDIPFHAIGMLRLNLTQVAAAVDSHGYAGLDVIHGLTGNAQQTGPILFPGPGMTTNLVTYSGEVPDPRETCGWENDSPVGLPLIMLLTKPPASGLTASLAGPTGTESTVAGTFCVVDKETYYSSNPIYGPTGAGILQADKAVILIPRQPLTNGGYSVTVQQPGQADVHWSFTVQS